MVARALAVLVFSRTKYKRIYLFFAGCVLAPIILLVLQAFVVGVFHNVIGFYGLIGIGGLVIGVACQHTIEIVMEWRASRKFEDPSLVAEYAFVSQGRSTSVYLAYELTVGIWFKFSGAKVRNLASEFHLKHLVPMLSNTGTFDALRGLVGLEAAIGVAGMWMVRYSYNRFRFRRWQAFKVGQLGPEQPATLPLERDFAALHTLFTLADEGLTALVVRLVNP